MAANHTSGCALWGNVLENVTAAASKGLALVNFGQIAQLRDQWGRKPLDAVWGLSASLGLANLQTALSGRFLGFWRMMARDQVARSGWQGSGAFPEIRYLVFITKGNLASRREC
jgi:hypothetical protein